MSYFSPCDSYNLNANPLCDLSDTRGTLAWTKEIRDKYPNESTPGYKSSLVSPFRLLIYNAFERDIAVVNIFFGKNTATGKNIFSLIQALLNS